MYVPVEPSLVGCVCGWEERCDTVDSKLDPDREDSKQPFPSPSPVSLLVCNP